MEPTAPLKPSLSSSSLSSIPTDKQTVSESYSKRKQNAAVLAAQYTPAKRAGEYISVLAFFFFLALTGINLYGHLATQYFWPIILLSCILSMALADLFSGLVHWAADTWGTLDTPMVGKTFIRSFREHHVDPFRITCHDFIETNGDNCMVAAIPLAVLSFVKIETTPTDVFIVSFLALLCVWVSLTNQVISIAIVSFMLTLQIDPQMGTHN